MCRAVVKPPNNPACLPHVLRLFVSLWHVKNVRWTTFARGVWTGGEGGLHPPFSELLLQMDIFWLFERAALS